MGKETAETIAMTALRRHEYAGRMIEIDEQYDVEPRFAKVLETMGASKPAEKKSKKEYQTRVLTAEN